MGKEKNIGVTGQALGVEGANDGHEVERCCGGGWGGIENQGGGNDQVPSIEEAVGAGQKVLAGYQRPRSL